ncbi:MAG: hypothetical protein GY703_12540 [Gammaproteobacteria bacterium]|nr:hypothetical protein [Gammaproteobacteria bacterium]
MIRHVSSLLLMGSLIIGIPVNPCFADGQKENEVMSTKSLFILLTATKGGVYQAYRDQWLAAPEANRVIRSDELPGEADWEADTQKKILLGWEENRDLYSTVLKAIDDVDVAFRMKTVAGMAGVYGEYYRRAQSEYQDRILPLCWEAALKFDGHWPGWKIMTFLHMLRALPNDRSVDPVLHVLTTSNSREVRETAAKVLAALPPQPLKSQLPELTKKHQNITDLLNRLGE